MTAEESVRARVTQRMNQGQRLRKACCCCCCRQIETGGDFQISEITSKGGSRAGSKGDGGEMEGIYKRFFFLLRKNGKTIILWDVILVEDLNSRTELNIAELDYRSIAEGGDRERRY